MAYRYGNRRQMALLPKSIEQYISKDDPVLALIQVQLNAHF